MRLFMYISIVLLPLSLTWADAERRNCVVCNIPLTNRFYLVTSPAFDAPVPVCQPCSSIKQRCAECLLPVSGRFKSIKDGRVLCASHAADAVFEEGVAQGIFNEAKRDVMRLLADTGKLPDRNVAVSLVNRAQLDELVAAHPEIHGESTLGLTRTQVNGDGSQQHRIYLLDGLTRPHLMGVCAHEYAHTWVNENVQRDIEASMVEAFCELVAYKLMDQYRHEGQKRAILANNYTQGKIDVLVKMDQDFRFADVLHWMKAGVDTGLSADDTGRVLAVKKPAAATPPWMGQRSGKTLVPDRLTLKGISGTAARRFALINDCTVMSDETAKVRVGQTNVTVRCLEISASSVRLQVVDSGQTLELFLRKK